MIREGIARAVDRKDLTSEMATAIMSEMMSGSATPSQIGSFITAMRMKGETEDELVGFALAMRGSGVKIKSPPNSVDLCGTGGDGSGTFNISTVASFVVAAAGVPVAKHGNRSVSSSSGSADLLESLGIPYDLSPRDVEECLRSTGYGFMFAPVFHASMRNVLSPRREIGLRTFFNLLGPMSNPAGVESQLMGVYDVSLVAKIATVLGRLGVKRAMVVNGSGMDEITNVGRTRVAELRNSSVNEYDLHPSDFGIALADSAQLTSASAVQSARAAMSVLKGEMSPRRDVVLMNAGAAIHVSGAAADIFEGVSLAEEAIDSGRAMAKLRQVSEFTLAKEREKQKALEVGQLAARRIHPEVLVSRSSDLTNHLVERVSALDYGQKLVRSLDQELLSRPSVLSVLTLTRALTLGSEGGRKPPSGRQSKEDLVDKLSSPELSIIGEYKPRAPSKSQILPPPDPEVAAAVYDQSGMAAVSVLVENVFFGGGPELFAKIRSIVKSPMVFKDFVVSEDQLQLAKNLGADAVLLIAKALSKDTLDRFIKLSRELGLEPLVELHDTDDLKKLESLDSKDLVKIIGVNSRDLRTMKVDVQGMKSLRSAIPENRLVIAESGVRSGKDLLLLKEFDGALVGSALMEAEDLSEKAQELVAFGRKVVS